jgi:hypothetical protein
MTRWDWFTDNRVYDRKRVARDELELRYQHHQIYTKKGHGNILTPLAYMNRLRNSLKSIPKDLLHQCNMEHRYDYINRKGVIRDKTFKKGGCTSRKWGLTVREVSFMDKQYQEYLKNLEKEKQEKILSQQQETESFFELDTVIPVNTVNTVNIVDTIDTKDSMDNLHTVNTIDTKIDTVIPIGLGGLVITGIIAYLVSKK